MMLVVFTFSLNNNLKIAESEYLRKRTPKFKAIFNCQKHKTPKVFTGLGRHHHEEICIDMNKICAEGIGRPLPKSFLLYH